LQHNNNKIDAALLGKIMLARFLALPLRAFDRLVIQAESSTGFNALRPWVTVGRLEGARVVHDAAGIPQTKASLILGEVREAGRDLTFLYHRDSYAREYRFDDEEGMNRLMAREETPRDFAGTLRRLRLINTRNRLTHALVQAVLAAQAAYLRSGQALSLLPLTQAEISTRLRSESNLSVVADPGRISRLVRGLSIALANGKAVPLSILFPKPRQVHCHFVDHMIKTEKTWMSEGLLQGPLTDEAVAAILEREHGIRLSRRTVANIRHDLAIPDYKRRSQRTDYLAATEEFSALVPLTAQALRTAVPVHSGVYEIRTAFTFRPSEERDWPGKSVPVVPHGVVYIGSAGDLRKRLGDHLRGSSDNALLYRHVADGAARVRFRLVSEGWRVVERELYQAFCETFGTPPPCNRMSP
jgi:RNA polymerase sigma-54 factor